jgi:hypothetical protein
MFSVFKPQTALAEVHAAWHLADGHARATIELAMLGLERLLQENPHDHGESRGDGTRVLFQHPLAVTVTVDDAQKLVRVLRVWTYRRQAA